MTALGGGGARSALVMATVRWGGTTQGSFPTGAWAGAGAGGGVGRNDTGVVPYGCVGGRRWGGGG